MVPSGMRLAHGPSLVEREREAIELIAQALPEMNVSCQIWSHVELIERSGRVKEADLLVLGHHALYVVDVKHWRGVLSHTGNAWRLSPPTNGPENATRTISDPVWLVHNLAKSVKATLIRQNPALRKLWVEALVFVPEDDFTILSESSVPVITQKQLAAVFQRGELPGKPYLTRREPVDDITAHAVIDVLNGLRAHRLDRRNISDGARELFLDLRADLRSQGARELSSAGAEQRVTSWPIEEIAACWIVSCGFVRALEERGVIEPAVMHDGPGALQAREQLSLMLRQAMQHVAGEPVLSGSHNSMWTVLPSESGARALIDFFWPTEGAPNRFVGDAGHITWTSLYQNISESLRKQHGFVATPQFVSGLMLDLTLDIALSELGPENVRILDPACGSGTILSMAFDRILSACMHEKPEADVKALARAVLERVHGVDISPMAALIARARLVLAYIDQLTGQWKEPGPLGQIFESPLPIRVAIGDALDIRAPESEHLNIPFDVVVCTPPYVTCNDEVRRELYRQLYDSASGNYSLTAPFIERCFSLAAPHGLVGVLSANAFYKRRFGKQLVENVLAGIELTRILDTSGAYIPGFGFPTVVLVGRNREPLSGHIRTAFGKRGEPHTPLRPESGRVWSSLRAHYDELGYQDEFIAVEDRERDHFAMHPWVLATEELQKLRQALQLNTKLGQIVRHIRNVRPRRFDELFLIPEDVAKRFGVECDAAYPCATGESISDWSTTASLVAITPETSEGHPLAFDSQAGWSRFLWPYRSTLTAQTASMEAFSPNWWTRFRKPRPGDGPSIAGRYISTRNQFALHPGCVFDRATLLIDFPATVTEDDAFAVLGYLNSSAVCYWLKQNAYQKSSIHDRASSETTLYEFSAGVLNQLPIPAPVLSRGNRIYNGLVELSRRLHETAAQMAECTPEHVLAHWTGSSRNTLLRSLSDAQQRKVSLLRRMICDQEELDWLVYAALDLVNHDVHRDVRNPLGVASTEERPYLWLSDLAPISLDSRLVDSWSYRRSLLRQKNALNVLERVEYKRSFADPSKDQTKHRIDACERWLIARVEREMRSLAEPKYLSASDLADRMTSDPRVGAVFSLVETSRNMSLSTRLEALLSKNAVPFLAALRHTESGMKKRARWLRVWELQHRQDVGAIIEGESAELSEPPLYARIDYRDAITWRFRGTLDIPREPFLVHRNGQSDEFSAHYGWSGWTVTQRASALMDLVEKARTGGFAQPSILCPLLAGLLELALWTEMLPVDGTTRQAFDYRRFVEEGARGMGLSVDAVGSWRPSTW